MGIQFSSLKNETVIFIIPHTINTITIHVFKIISSIIPNYFQNSFNRDRVNLGVSKTLIPYLVFDYVITTHQFFPSEYLKPLSKDRQKLHQEVDKLHQQGWGYTKIHHHLIKNGFEIGKSRTCVDYMIKKMKKRNEFFHQPIMDGIGNFRIEWREV